MTKDELNDQYFDWIVTLVDCENYRKLLAYLHSRDFIYSIPMDANRYDDGISLRYRFGYDCDIPERLIASYLDNRSCTVLEMMAALALRCEESLMSDPDEGDRVPEWFHSMLDSLGIADMNDRNYERDIVGIRISRFLNRDYAPNGFGGLFTVNGRGDLRNVEIWCQMCWYLNTIYDSII